MLAAVPNPRALSRAARPGDGFRGWGFWEFRGFRGFWGFWGVWMGVVEAEDAGEGMRWLGSVRSLRPGERPDGSQPMPLWCESRDGDGEGVCVIRGVVCFKGVEEEVRMGGGMWL